jgi:hypothetical protein
MLDGIKDTKLPVCPDSFLFNTVIQQWVHSRTPDGGRRAKLVFDRMLQLPRGGLLGGLLASVRRKGGYQCCRVAKDMRGWGRQRRWLRSIFQIFFQDAASSQPLASP